jgi:hypothetical protein
MRIANGKRQWVLATTLGTAASASERHPKDLELVGLATGRASGQQAPRGSSLLLASAERKRASRYSLLRSQLPSTRSECSTERARTGPSNVQRFT